MISTIYVATKNRRPQLAIESVEVKMGFGITGDRHFKKRARLGQNITFIEAEQIEQFNSAYKQSIGYDATRRNIITRGIRLNDLVGVEFSIGDTKFKGIELCEPCVILGRLLNTDTLSEQQIIKAFWGKGGLRADVLTSGVISVGMNFKI